MRAEKQYLVDEVGGHLDKSNYLFLTDFNRVNVAETAELRAALAEYNAEFHVVKNSAFRVAAGTRDFPDLSDHLIGPTAIVVGGRDAPGVAKALGAFFKDKDKLEVKVGVLENKVLHSDDVEALAKLPPLEVVRGQLLSLINTPARQIATVIQAVPQSVLNLLNAKFKEGREG